jgi:hypothetical protein
MSRLQVFGPDNRLDGEIITMLDRGWMLTGHPSVTGGGSTMLNLTTDQATNSFLQFGRLVLATHPRLPSWAGVLDPPWSMLAPVQVAAYNAEYLLSLRSPDVPSFLLGSVGDIAGQMLRMFNERDDFFVRVGDTSRADPTSRQLTLDGRTYWDQLKALLERSGCEMQTRPEKDADGRLVIYLDIATRIGIDTHFLYFDGTEGNITLNPQDAVLDGPITNRVIGMGDESGQASRIRTDPIFDEDSIQLYRMRSELVQFRGVTEQSTLDRYSRNYVAYRAFPRFSFLMNILDKGDAFANARLGNSAMVHISEAILPGGIRGWRGLARIVALAYTESQNLLSAKMVTI